MMGMIQTDWVNSYVDPRGRGSRQSKRKREKNPRGEASVNTAHSYGPIAQTVYSTLIRHQEHQIATEIEEEEEYNEDESEDEQSFQDPTIGDIEESRIIVEAGGRSQTEDSGPSFKLKELTLLTTSIHYGWRRAHCLGVKRCTGIGEDGQRCGFALAKKHTTNTCIKHYLSHSLEKTGKCDSMLIYVSPLDVVPHSTHTKPVPSQLGSLLKEAVVKKLAQDSSTSTGDISLGHALGFCPISVDHCCQQKNAREL
ncbi:Uncharacterized protein APZ42_029005 [Daphnia magna]|uniref:Uncharacterized protein n=1 Tax=Daphnia magna TaxID=35525 RepID=A0A164Q0E0_9CRUS|nr:Uncharacterized protein APZ42_029005 [Daphnia magna]